MTLTNHPPDASAGIRTAQPRAPLDARDTGPKLLRFRHPRRGRLCDAGLAPEDDHQPGITVGLANYAYHLDAGKFAPFLAKHCTEKLGVRHVLANVVQVNQNESGDIQKRAHNRRRGEISGGPCSSIAAGFFRAAHWQDTRRGFQGLQATSSSAIPPLRGPGFRMTHLTAPYWLLHTISTAQGAG